MLWSTRKGGVCVIHICRFIFLCSRNMPCHSGRHRNETYKRCRKRIGNARIQRRHFGLCRFFNNERRIDMVQLRLSSLFVGQCAEHYEYNRDRRVRFFSVSIYRTETAVAVMAIEIFPLSVSLTDVHHHSPCLCIFFYRMAFLL